MTGIEPRSWLKRLHNAYAPSEYGAQGFVLLLDGHRDDLFFSDVEHPAVPLYRLLYDRFCDAVDAFVWYKVAGEGGQLSYEFNHLANETAEPSAAQRSGETSDDILDDLIGGIEDDTEAWKAQHAGRTTRTCIPQEAIREITPLLRRSEGRVVVVFQDVFWAINEDTLLAQLRTWPELCQTNHHLVVFALARDDLPWIRQCFDPVRSKGVKQLTVDGPTSEEVKVYLILRHLQTRQHLFDWSLLDDIATHLAQNVGAKPSEGFKSLVKSHIPNFEESGQPLDQSWLDRQPRTGHAVQEVHLDDIVLKPEERAFFERILLPALRDPDWRQKQAARLKIAKERVPVPTRILLYGPPGTGKTTIGKMIATESRMRFYSVTAADFQSRYRGGPVEKVAQHFAEWRNNAPCVVFWDEVDSIAADRDRSQHEDNPIVQILAETESTAGKDEDVIIICATNRPESLDSAFRSRFSGHEFLIGYPDQDGRERLIRMYFATHLLEESFSVPELAELFENRAPREIKNCSDFCIQQLTANAAQTTITRDMVVRWLSTRPIDQKTVQRWHEEETQRSRRLRDQGVV